MKQIQNTEALKHRRAEASGDSIRERDSARILRFKQVAALVGLGKSSI